MSCCTVQGTSKYFNAFQVKIKGQGRKAIVSQFPNTPATEIVLYMYAFSSSPPPP